MCQFRRFTMKDRIKLEVLYNRGVPVSSISQELGFHRSSVYREIKQGLYKHLETDYTYTVKYSADKAQRKAVFNRSQGATLKLSKDYIFCAYVTDMIAKKYSPASILMTIQKEGLSFDTKICLSTLYNYIRAGMFLNISMKDLPRPRKKKRRIPCQKKDPHYGTSIEERPKEINNREEFGHWEMDSVIGKREKGETLLVLTERKTDKELIFKSKNKTAISTVQILNRIERAVGSRVFRTVFRSITMDNGTEFSTPVTIEKSCLTKRNRTKTYYCHPFCSSERGSNENQNGFIRRFIPKGTKIESYSLSQIWDIQEFINNYPRAKFGGQSSNEVFESELSKLGIKNFFENLSQNY